MIPRRGLIGMLYEKVDEVALILYAFFRIFTDGIDI